MNVVPVMHSTNLVLPAIVDAGDSPTIDVGPRRAIVDHVVPADVDLADVHIVIPDSVTNAAAHLVADVVAKAPTHLVTNVVANARAI